MQIETIVFKCELIFHHMKAQRNGHRKCWESLTWFLKKTFIKAGERFFQLKVFNSMEVILPFIPSSLKVHRHVRMNCAVLLMVKLTVISSLVALPSSLLATPSSRKSESSNLILNTLIVRVVKSNKEKTLLVWVDTQQFWCGMVTSNASTFWHRARHLRTLGKINIFGRWLSSNNDYVRDGGADAERKIVKMYDGGPEMMWVTSD